MSGIKGSPGQEKLIEKLDGFTDLESQTRTEFVTVQPIGSTKHGQDIVLHGSFKVGSSDLTEANSTTRVIVATAHTAKKGDFLRFETAGLNQYLEAPVIHTTANNIVLGIRLPVAPTVGDSFAIMRYVTQKLGSDGSNSSGSVTFTRDSSDQIVTENTTTGSEFPLPVHEIGSGLTDLARNVYTITPITTGAYVTLKASLAIRARSVEVFDSSGQTLVLAVGGVGSEVDKFYIIPGGNGRVPLNIPSGSRVSVKAVSANATVGELTVNFYA